MSQFVISIILSGLALLVSLAVLIREVRNTREAREFESFLVSLRHYQQLVLDRKKKWATIRNTLKDNPKASREIHDRQDSLSYLLIRLTQSEPMYAIEHGLLDNELKSLNFLDKLCEVASRNARALSLLLLTDANEISYYQNRLADLLKLHESQQSTRQFPIPHFDSLKSCDISGFFGQETEQRQSAEL